MKNVIQDLRQEIDYLGALAEMYGRGRNLEAQAAALEAKAALERLVNIIKPPPHQSRSEFPVAA